MKKTLAIVTFALAIVMSFALAACTVQHVHNFDTPWSYNETEHWHTCTDCDEIRDKAAHTGGKAICGDRAICEVCGQPYGEIGNHDWGEWKQTKAPTCSLEGVETRVCKINPEHKENRPIAKLGHEWSEDWKKNKTEHWHYCSVCNEVKDKAEHLFGDYQVTTQPTYESTGLKKRTCSVCLYEETEVIDKLVKVDTITIEGESEVSLDVGEFVTLTALVAPENATDKGLNWQSSDTSVAEVVKGRVVARGAGVATITVTANDGQGASATVTVKVTVLPESVTLNCDDKYIAVGQKTNITATVLPADATDTALTYEADNPSVATVDENGQITGLKEGVVTVTAKTSNDVTASVSFYVTAATIDGDLTDALYQGKYALHNDALKYNNNTATNPVKNLTKVVLGESGLYITHDVTDNFVGKQTRVEDFICFGDTKVVGSATQKSNTYYFRFYLHKENGKNFTNYYNGKESDTNTYPWTYDASLEVYYVVKATENGYTVEAFIPYATLGVSQKPESVQFLGLSMIYPNEADAAADKNIKSAAGNSYGMAQKNFFNLANYLTFDDLGYYGWKNSTFGIIENIGDVILGSPDVVDGNYQTEITIKSKFQFNNSFTAYEGLTFDNEYVTEKGSGIYKISVPEEKQPEYKDGVTVSVKRGTEVLGTFKIKLSKNIPVTQITVSGAKTAFLGDEVQLSATIAPSDATTTTVTWASKNEDIATIDRTGKVSTLKAGTATFTATADGIVTEHTIVISDTLQIEIQGPGGAFVGDDVQLTAIVTPKPNDYTVTWDSNDKEIATIDSTGKVTLLKEGTVTLTATVNGFTGEYTLFVGEVLAKAAVKVDYTGKTVQNSGTNDTVTLDTVTITLDSNGKNGTEFVHTDKNTFNDGIDGDKEGALATNNKKGSYLLIKDYALGKGDFTISAWVYASSEAVLKGNSSQIFATSAYDKQNPGGKIALAARKDTKGQFVTYKINNDKNNNFPSARTNLVGWHKYTVVRAGTSFKVYVDDVLMHEKTLAADTDFGTQTICFGSYTGETWAYNDGVLVYDNVTIYDTAITENQLKALVAAKK